MPDLKTKPALNLEYVLWERTYGDIRVLGTYLLTDQDRPCLVLIPAFARPTHERVTPCVVTVDSAWKWVEETGDPADTIPLSVQFAAALGMSPNKDVLLRIHRIINACITDLLNMPPFPRFTEGEAAADLIATDPETGKIIHEGTVTDVH